MKQKIIRLIQILKIHGISVLFKRIFLNKQITDMDYKYWIKNCEKKYDRNKIKYEINNFFLKKPKICIVVPVFNPDLGYFKETIKTVMDQYYKNWELILVDNASNISGIKEFINSILNNKIKYFALNENKGISFATNYAISKTQAEYIAFLDHDDLLKKEALYEIVKIINKNYNVDIIYSDEDKITTNTETRQQPFFKPAWGPDTLITYMFINHLTVIKKDLILKEGGFNSFFDGTQDYDLLLRITKKTNNIYHCPYILYHWRMSEKSTSYDIENKPYVFDKYMESKNKNLKNNNFDIEFINKKEQFASEIRYILKNNKNNTVFIIFYLNEVDEIKNIKYNLIFIYKKCANIKYIIFTSNKKNKLHIVKNNLKHIKVINNHKIVENYNRIINDTDADTYLLLDSSIKLKNGNFNDLFNHAKLKHVGVTTSNILYKNKILYSGIMMINNKLLNLCKNININNKINMNKVKLTENIPFAGRFLLCFTKEKFNLVGGFDNFKNNYFDIDFCRKLLMQGFYNVKRGDVEFECINKKNISNIFKEYNKDKQYLNEINKIYGSLFYNKFFYYNKNLNKKNLDFSLDLEEKQS